MMDNKKSKAYRIFVAFLSIFLCLCGFGFIVAAAVMQHNGLEPNPLIIIFGFIGCEIISLIILIKNFQHFIVYDFEKATIKYDNTPFATLEHVSQEEVHKQFVNQKFKLTQHDYLKKKVCSFLKDFICCYVKSVKSPNVEVTIEEELEKFNSLGEKSPNICFFLFVYKNNVTDRDIEILREYSKIFIINETIVPVRHCHTAIIVLVDCTSNKGYYLDVQKRHAFSVYAHGCRLLNKAFKNSRT